MMNEEWPEWNTDLCRCCHAEGVHKNIYEKNVWMNEEVVYADILRECFEIELFPVTEPSHQKACGICADCIEQLHGARYFKKQVQKCELQFRELYITHFVTEDINEETDDLDLEKVVQVTDSEADDDEIGGGDDNHDDDDVGRLSDHEEAEFRKLNAAGEAVKPLKAAKLLKAEKPSKASKAKKKSATKGLPKVESQKEDKPSLDVDTGEVLEGIKLKKRSRNILRVQEGVDYKWFGELYQCSRCNKKFHKVVNVKTHIKHVHLNVPRYTCPVCSQAFMKIASFVKHKLEEHDIDHTFKCNACAKTFNLRSQLQSHIDGFHMLGKKFKCDVCDFECFSHKVLGGHMINHKTVKEFHCMYCKKSFKRKNTLRFHERIHTGDKRKVCKVCGDAFVQKASLNYHMTKYHPGTDF